MAKYYLAFETMVEFLQLRHRASLREIVLLLTQLGVVSKAKEFSVRFHKVFHVI
jgi:hypothetical protein